MKASKPEPPIALSVDEVSVEVWREARVSEPAAHLPRRRRARTDIERGSASLLAEDVVLPQPRHLPPLRRARGRDPPAGDRRRRRSRTSATPTSWTATGSRRSCSGPAIGGRELEGIDLLRFDEDGLIGDFTVMLRPISGLMPFAQAMGEKVAAAGLQTTRD